MSSRGLCNQQIAAAASVLAASSTEQDCFRVCLQLKFAYQCLLLEVAEQYSLPVADYANALQLQKALQVQTDEEAELAHLVEAEKRDWCKALLQHTSPARKVTDASAKSTGAAATNTLHIRLSDTSDVLDSQLCESMISGLKELAEEMRTLSQEW